MMNRRWLATAFCLLIPTGVVVYGEAPQPGSAELPVTRVVMFSSGVAFFQRDGQVDGNVRIDLPFHAKNINDLLKSLLLQDQGGGRISSVNYDSRDPIEKTLKSFAIDLTGKPSLGQLLDQVRGEQVEVLYRPQHGKEEKTTGLIVGIEKQKKKIGKDEVVETEQLNLLTVAGLQGLPMEEMQRLRFLKPELEKEFRQALEILATGHDKQKKTVSLNFLGNGKRAVRVGYVTESPIWKTSYRLALDKEGKQQKAFLQGWAIVENTTDEDWNQVSLGLISGRPISFQMDLYEPLYVPRPVVEPELFASLRPQTYSGDLQGRRKAMLKDAASASPADQAKNGSGVARGRVHVAAGEFLFERQNLPREEADRDKAGRLGLKLDEGVASAAVATELGEYFQYQIEQPVTLRRQKSALLPIVQQAVEATKVSIYNEAVHAKYPLLGLRFKNTTGLHLMQGPLTVLENGSYAGDARINDVQPNETRLVSYAVDLGTEVAPEYKEANDHLVAIKIFKGILHATHKVRNTKTYTVKNRSEHPRLVLIEHPYRAGWKLVTPEKPAEISRDYYRFEVRAEPNKPIKEEVVEENTRIDQLVLTNSNDDAVRLFLRASVTTPKVKVALEEALARKAKLAEVQHAIEVQENALQVIEKDQARMRANMERVPQTSEAYKRYLKKFDDQETEIEKRSSQIAELQESAERERKGYETFLLGLNVE